jgi:hypothetical protein
MSHKEDQPQVNTSTKIAKNIVGNQHMGLKDVVNNAHTVYAASLPNDADLGIEGVDAQGNPVGIVFTDPRLAVLYSAETDRTVITMRHIENEDTNQ